jgi:hypothetical protein
MPLLPQLPSRLQDLSLTVLRSGRECMSRVLQAAVPLQILEKQSAPPLPHTHQHHRHVCFQFHHHGAPGVQRLLLQDVRIRILCVQHGDACLELTDDGMGSMEPYTGNPLDILDPRLLRDGHLLGRGL